MCKPKECGQDAHAPLKRRLCHQRCARLQLSLLDECDESDIPPRWKPIPLPQASQIPGAGPTQDESLHLPHSNRRDRPGAAPDPIHPSFADGLELFRLLDPHHPNKWSAWRCVTASRDFPRVANKPLPLRNSSMSDSIFREPRGCD